MDALGDVASATLTAE